MRKSRPRRPRLQHCNQRHPEWLQAKRWSKPQVRAHLLTYLLTFCNIATHIHTYTCAHRGIYLIPQTYIPICSLRMCWEWLQCCKQGFFDLRTPSDLRKRSKTFATTLVANAPRRLQLQPPQPRSEPKRALQALARTPDPGAQTPSPGRLKPSPDPLQGPVEGCQVGHAGPSRGPGGGFEAEPGQVKTLYPPPGAGAWRATGRPWAWRQRWWPAHLGVVSIKQRLYPKPGQVAGLAMHASIHASVWGTFAQRLADKAAQTPDGHRTAVIAVDPKNTSRQCSACGHVAAENRESQALFACQSCGHTAHADLNAAHNILARAITTLPTPGYAAGRAVNGRIRPTPVGRVNHPEPARQAS